MSVEFRYDVVLARVANGNKKFVATTIRPTKIGFKKLLDYDTCAQFVAGYTTYEPLIVSDRLVIIVCPRESNSYN